ncbi:hypothetical protein [Candidatus Finniella inopinata]|uniref:DUF3450 family protein n=1 Tax=Candidatus Finniella inopinata TaxID=1696036 RepID=A0A4Q7DJU4_9PROT|nr:hypothetical protein [Candidatus Finniella inopinata]RZI47022.1 hypothetical protein EQU50_00080 [Candidatus Finniella inopinata]
MYLNIFKNIVRVAVISFLVMGMQAIASTSVDIEKDNTDLTKLRDLKVQLNQKAADLEKILSNVISKQGDSRPTMDAFKQTILRSSMEEGIFIECGNEGRANSFFVVTDLEFEPYTFVISKRLSFGNAGLWFVSDTEKSYYIHEDYGEGGSKEGSVELLKVLANLQ